MSGKHFIELYSGNRNRNQYPEPASFEVPFASVAQPTKGKNAQDPVNKGGVYYKFIVDAGDNYTSLGTFGTGSTADAPVLSLTQDGQHISTLKNYYVGWYLADITALESNPDDNNAIQFITAYAPETLKLTLLLPLSGDPTGHKYGLFISEPKKNQISIPAIDQNFNAILDYELAYNGYYLVFESPNNAYSNQYNSNIVSRRIKYYDSTIRVAYFDDIPVGYRASSGDTFTLRDSLPEERWQLDVPTFYNNSITNPLIGPLLGNVITLPQGASTTDNYYKGMYVYFYSNAPYTYPVILPPVSAVFSNTSNPMPGVFYPIYGSYYVNAYNGSTRQLSVDADPNVTSFPTYIEDIGYNSGSFVVSPSSQGKLTITNTYDDNYLATLLNTSDGDQTMDLDSQLYTPQLTYTVTWVIRSENFNGQASTTPPSIYVTGFDNDPLIRINLATDSDEFITYTFQFTPDTPNIMFNISPGDWQGSSYSIEWSSFLMSRTDIINMTMFTRDNFTPLAYSGSMTLNEACCYEVDLVALSLPNESLLTGSRISFYPYVFVEFSNATSPNGASRQIIYSNNPNSYKALFIATVPNNTQPLLSTFISLTGGGMVQQIKFKPQDNLRFSVYLPDGTLFKTLETDFFSPYIPSSRVQIDAVFSIRKI